MKIKHRISRDNLPHLIFVLHKMLSRWWFTLWSRLYAVWWRVDLGKNCKMIGLTSFIRHPGSTISISSGCEFRSLPTSNYIGVNRPCIISTLNEGASIEIGFGCGFSGTVIGCANRIVLGSNIRCGANTLITDNDWHLDDPRIGEPEPVVIEDDVWLAANVVVLKGVRIGKGTLVGANSLVTKSLPAGVIAAGCPAKVIKKIIDV